MELPNHYSLVGHDEKHFHLHDNRDNKSFKVARKELHPAHQVKILQMKKFDEGGKVPVPSQTTDTPKPTINEKHVANNGGSGATSISDAFQKLAHPWAKGGEIPKYFNGVDAVPDQSKEIRTQASDMLMQGPFDLSDKEFSEGDQMASDRAAPVGGWNAPPAVGDQILNSRSPASPAQALMSGQVADPQHGASGSWTDAPMNQGPATPPQPPTVVDKFQANARAQEQALAGKAAAESGMGSQEARAYQNYNNLAHDVFKQSQQDLWNQGVENDKLRDEIAGTKIDPNQYFHNMGTGQKVGTAIALILGGLGAGIAHGGPNLAYEMMQKAVDRDIDSQKINLGKKQSLLSYNMQKYHDMTLAQHATSAQLNSILQGQIAQTAAKFGGQINSLNTQATLNQLQNDNLTRGMEMQKLLTQQKMREALATADVSGQDPSLFVQHVVPEKHQDAVFKEIERAQDTRRMGDSILQAYDKAAAEMHGFSGTANALTGGFYQTPGMKEFHQALQPTFKDLEGTVRQAAMDNTFKNLSPTATQLKSTQGDQRNAVINYLKSKMSAPTAKGFGIDLEKFNSTKPVTPRHPLEGQTIVNPSTGQRAVMQNGNWTPIK